MATGSGCGASTVAGVVATRSFAVILSRHRIHRSAGDRSIGTYDADRTARLTIRKSVIRRRRQFRGRLQAAREPGGLAAGATNSTAGLTQRGRFDVVGGGTVWTGDQHGIGRYLGAQTYQPSVNGSETMTGPANAGIWGFSPALLWRPSDNLVKAQVRALIEGRGTAFRPWAPGAAGRRFDGPLAAISWRGVGGPIRERGITLWLGARGSARPHVPDRSAFFPISHRSLRRGEDVPPAPVIPVYAANPRIDHPVRSRRRDSFTRCGCDVAAAHWHRFSGFSSSRPHDDL